VRSHQWFTLYFIIVGILTSNGVPDLVDDSVPDMVVPADVLVFCWGNEERNAWDLLSDKTADCTGTLRVANVQGRRRSQ
jgi:hypothetical protein